MKKLFTITLTLMLFGGVSNAVTLTLDAVDGTWQNPVGGAPINYFYDVAVSYGNGDEDQIRWGVVDPCDPQSGLGFTGRVPDPCSMSFDIGDTFEIGQLQHFNNPIGHDTAASAVELTVDLNFSVPDVDPSFTFTFLIDETPNEGKAPPEVPDVITFPNSYPNENFIIGDTAYTLQILGFGPDAGNLSNSFISPEGGTNSVLLWGKVVTRPPLDIDIKPQSCPNPLRVNFNGNGVIPVAILGTEDFDVLDIDVATIALEGVSPVRSSFEDVSTPFDGEDCECTTDGADGYLDLTLKFNRQDILTALEGILGDLSEIEHKTEVPLYLTAQLMGEETTLEGSDCIRILNKMKRQKR